MGLDSTVIPDMRRFAGELRDSFDARYLALALAVPLFEVFRRVSFSLPLAVAATSSANAIVMCAAAGFLAAGLAFTATGLRGRTLAPQTVARASLAFCVLAALGMLPAAAGLLPACAGAAGGAGYVVLGAGLCTLLLGWIKALGRCETTACIVYVGASFPLGSLLLPAAIALDNPLGLWGLLFALLATCCLVLLWIALRPRPAGDSDTRASTSGETGATPEAGETEGIREAVRQGLTAPTVALALTMYTWGTMVIPPRAYLHDHQWWVYLAGGLVALCIACLLAYALRGRPRYRVMQQKLFFVLPVFAVFLAYFSFIRMLGATGTVKGLLSVGYNMSLAGFFTLFTASTAARCREKGVSAECAAGPGLVACGLSYCLGALLYETCGNVAMYFQVVLTTLYILGLALISTRRASLGDDSRLGKNCLELAARHDLSQRETEVLQLTVSGYSVARIAEKFSISPETVRTHKKRVYAKLDVHSHEELMRLVRSGG